MRIGYDDIFNSIIQDFEKNHGHHANLFIGKKGLGKTKTALDIAVQLQGFADNTVLRAQLLHGVHMDTILFLDNGENLSIAELRILIERLNQSFDSKYLIVIIENIGRMRTEAANALLKNIEEPQDGIVFFMTANNEDDVLPTIKSRCRVYNFHSLSDAKLNILVENDPQKKSLLAYSMGRAGKLKLLTENAEYLQIHIDAHRDWDMFFDKMNIGKAYELVRKYEKSENLDEFFEIGIYILRNLLLKNLHLKHLNSFQISHLIDILEQAKLDLHKNMNVKLVLETTLLNFIT